MTVQAVRLALLRERLAADELPAILVSKLVNVRYLTGFTGSNAHLLVTPDSTTFITDPRYEQQAERQLGANEIAADLRVTAPGTTSVEALVDCTAPCERVGVEAASLTWAEAAELEDRLPTELIPTRDFVERLRAVKDDEEIEAIRMAVATADAAFGVVLDAATPELTEAGLALALEWEMRTHGASGVSFDPIVAAGQHSSLPHAVPCDSKLGTNRPIVVDFGCRMAGYCSDMTRTISFGEPVTDVERIHWIVGRAQDAARGAVRAGAECRVIDAEARQVIADAGYGENFVHGTGHGVGLEIHEAPRVNARSEDVLEAGMVIAVEPGVYLPGLGGVRLEDMLLVTPGGCETLTQSSRLLVR